MNRSKPEAEAAANFVVVVRALHVIIEQARQVSPGNADTVIDHPNAHACADAPCAEQNARTSGVLPGVVDEIAQCSFREIRIGAHAQAAGLKTNVDRGAVRTYLGQRCHACYQWADGKVHDMWLHRARLQAQVIEHLAQLPLHQCEGAMRHSDGVSAPRRVGATHGLIEEQSGGLQWLRKIVRSGRQKPSLAVTLRFGICTCAFSRQTRGVSAVDRALNHAAQRKHDGGERAHEEAHSDSEAAALHQVIERDRGRNRQGRQ